MSHSDREPGPIGRSNYAPFAERYADRAPTKAHNALYERPATLSLLPEVEGRRVLDAGCGPGLLSEILARRGASVHALDVTPAMVEFARRRCAELDVEVRQADLAESLPWLDDGSFDLVLSALTLTYVENLARPFAEFFRVARSGARLVISVEHPMFDWLTWRDKVDHAYYETALVGLHWSGFGEPRPYVEWYRRPLEAVLNPLADAGWVLERVLEPRPLEAMRDVDPKHYAELSREPCFLCLRARKPA